MTVAFAGTQQRRISDLDFESSLDPIPNYVMHTITACDVYETAPCPFALLQSNRSFLFWLRVPFGVLPFARQPWPDGFP